MKRGLALKSLHQNRAVSWLLARSYLHVNSASLFISLQGACLWASLLLIFNQFACPCALLLLIFSSVCVCVCRCASLLLIFLRCACLCASLLLIFLQSECFCATLHHFYNKRTIKTCHSDLEVCHPRCVKSNITVYNMYVLHIYSVRNTTINRWYYYVLYLTLQ